MTKTMLIEGGLCFLCLMITPKAILDLAKPVASHPICGFIERWAPADSMAFQSILLARLEELRVVPSSFLTITKGPGENPNLFHVFGRDLARRVEISESSPGPKLDLAIAYWQAGNVDPALRLFEAAAKDSKDEPHYGLLWSFMLFKAGRRNLSIVRASNYLARYPWLATAPWFAELQKQDAGAADQIIDLARKQVHQTNGTTDEVLAEGWMAVIDDQAEFASRDFSAVISQLENNGRAWSGLGWVSQVEGDKARARRYEIRARYLGIAPAREVPVNYFAGSITMPRDASQMFEPRATAY